MWTNRGVSRRVDQRRLEISTSFGHRRRRLDENYVSAAVVGIFLYFFNVFSFLRF
jgi:hypothetical protein